VLLGLVFESRSKLPDSSPWLFVLQNALLLPGVFDIKPIITVSWSLSYEIFFYIGLAAVVGVLGLRRWKPGARVLLWSAVAAAWVFGGSLVRGFMGSFVMFVPGLLVFEGANAAGSRVRVPPALEVAAWAALGATLLWIGLAGASSVQGVHGWGLPTAVLTFVLLGTVIGLFLFAAARGSGAVARGLGWRPLRYVGMVSYSFYLIHGLTINAIALVLRALAPPGSPFPIAPSLGAYVLLAVPVYGACVVTSVALFKAVEYRTMK
jgi:exopolysaccharide production protein ExoZ